MASVGDIGYAIQKKKRKEYATRLHQSGRQVFGQLGACVGATRERRPQQHLVPHRRQTPVTASALKVDKAAALGERNVAMRNRVRPAKEETNVLAWPETMSSWRSSTGTQRHVRAALLISMGDDDCSALGAALNTVDMLTNLQRKLLTTDTELFPQHFTISRGDGNNSRATGRGQSRRPD